MSIAVVERSSLYPEKYGAWAGFPQGHAPDYARCCEQVWGRERWPRHYQCTKKRGHGPDGAYCKQHDPDAVKARGAAAEAKWKAKLNEERYGWYGRDFFNALLKIAQGHNDARGLAQEMIDKFKSDQ